jgi:hypothetical protein
MPLRPISSFSDVGQIVTQPKLQREGSGQGVLYERILKAIPSVFSPIPTQGRGMQFGQRCS